MLQQRLVDVPVTEGRGFVDEDATGRAAAVIGELARQFLARSRRLCNAQRRPGGMSHPDGAYHAPDRGRQSMAKQYNRPAPPVDTRLSWPQPRLACDEFHDPLFPPCLSEWPSCAEPVASALVQLPHV